MISVDSLLVYIRKYYVKAYIDNCAYKIIDKQMINYLDDNRFNVDDNFFFFFFFFDKWIIKMLYYDRIDTSKSSDSKECVICHYCFF